MLLGLHSHTTFSDGTLPIEDMVAAAERRCYTAMAITDHVRNGDPNYLDVVTAVRDAVYRLAPQTPLQLFAGAEVTDFEPARIHEVAQKVRQAGADVVVVHGECLVLDVAPGTNAAAVRSSAVDVLAHPGLLNEEDAMEAIRHGVHIESSARHGADYSNGHVYRVARRCGAPLVVNSDAHEETGLISARKVTALLRGAGAPIAYVAKWEAETVPMLLERCKSRQARVQV